MKNKCMIGNIKPSLQENPYHFILHIDINDLCLHRPPELIAKSITDLASIL